MSKTLDNTDLVLRREVVLAGFTQHTAKDVKSWGADNGFKVNAGKGRMALALVDAFNEAHGKGKRKGQYVLRSKATAVRDWNYTTAKGRKGKFKATTTDIRAWAREEGLTEADRGRFSQEIVDAYGQMLRAK